MQQMPGIYFKLLLRKLSFNKVFSIINIAGLSTGLTCCILILLYTKDEVSYDQFHEKKDQVFQLVCDRIEKEGSVTKSALAAMVQGPAFKAAIPEILDFTRVNPKVAVVKIGDQVFSENISWVDENFFSIFSFPLVSGMPNQVLSGYNSMVVTSETANKYFGTADAIGKTVGLEVDGRFETFIITGIAKAASQNSSIKFNVLVPFKHLEKISPDNGWMWFSFPTFFIIHPSADIDIVVTKMETVYQLQAKSEIAMNHEAGYDTKFTWGLLPFTKMHLNVDYQGTPGASDPIYSYILSGIATFILLIAMINFVNLSLAESMKRTKEVGVRKVIGGTRIQLIRQFLAESMIVSLLAFALAIAGAFLLLPFFNELVNKKLSLSYLFDFKLVMISAALFLFTFLLAGFYPAMILSGLKPVDTLNNKVKIIGNGYLSKVLVVFQFSLATLLIILTLFINAQFRYLTESELGYNDKNIIECVVDKAIMDKQLMDVCKTAFSNIRGVENVAYCNVGKFGGKTQAGGKEFEAIYKHVDGNYLAALQVGILKGRNFSDEFPSDATEAVLVNETFTRDAGWRNPVGRTIDYMNIPGWGTKKIRIIGLVKDYHFESLKEKIKPEIFTMESQLPLGKFIIKINARNIPATLAGLEKSYHDLFPDHPFQYSFSEDLLRKNYDAELKWKQVTGFAAVIAIFISCIGLFGLTMLTTERRLKEVGIRKVLGASTALLVRLISFDFVKLVFLAFLVAVPSGWYIVYRWLQNFAYRIEMSWWLFAAAICMSMLIAMLTVSYHTIKAAMANPVDSLRNNQTN